MSEAVIMSFMSSLFVPFEYVFVPFSWFNGFDSIAMQVYVLGKYLPRRYTRNSAEWRYYNTCSNNLLAKSTKHLFHVHYPSGNIPYVKNLYASEMLKKSSLTYCNHFRPKWKAHQYHPDRGFSCEIPTKTSDSCEESWTNPQEQELFYEIRKVSRKIHSSVFKEMKQKLLQFEETDMTRDYNCYFRSLVDKFC